MMQPDNALYEMASDLFGSRCRTRDRREAEQGAWPGALWEEIEGVALPAALIPEQAGGYGVSATEALSVIRSAGEHAVPLPLAETMMAGWLLAKAGLGIPGGPLGVIARREQGLTIERDGGRWAVRGSLRQIPWGRHVPTVVTVVKINQQHHVVRLPTVDARQDRGENIAREPRDTLTFDVLLTDGDVAPSNISPSDVQAVGAAMRSQQIAGALSRITDMSVQYAQERKQFGRPIGKFQAIQQNLALLAAQTAAANAAADIAAEAVSDGVDQLAIACAKVRCNEAASLAAPIAHQIHGAFGFTHEYDLHFYTKRLMSWREEFGNEVEWSARIGEVMKRHGADQLWASITNIGARA